MEEKVDGRYRRMWSCWRRLTVLPLCIAAFVVAIPALSAAQDFQGVGILSGGSYSQAFGVSADGTVVFGASNMGSPVGVQAFSWTQTSGLVGLGWLPGSHTSFAFGANIDGSVIVGSSFTTSNPQGEAFRWTAAGGMAGLGFLPGGTISSAGGISGDGSIVVGYSDSAATGVGGNFQAFIWMQATGMTALGVLPGGTTSTASAINSDGTVVVGNSTSTAFSVSSGCFLCGEAFRWTAAGGMVGLGALPGGSYSAASAVNRDGSVIVGQSEYTPGSGNLQAFRWAQTGGMIGLGFLPGGVNSSASGVSADGTVVVGYSTSTSAPAGEAFRWTSGTGMQSLKNLLVASGVNMTGWTLSDATGVSANGTVIVGYGTDPANNTEGWIARCDAVCSGLITPATVQESFSGQSAVGESGNAALGAAFSTIASYATQTHGGSGSGSYSGFAYGGYDSDPTASGTLGIVHDLPDAMLVGATVGANYIKTSMVFDGSAKFGAGTGGAFIARIPQFGLQWLLGIGGIASGGDINRGYLNGSGQASSDGHTTANGYGGTARIGWTFNNVLAETQLTPFASYSVTTLHTNGYTETDGPFPAQFDGFTDTAKISRLGADARYTFAPGEWIWGTLDWAHRFGGGASATIAGSLIGLFALSTPGSSVMQGWAEVTAGFRMPIWKTAALTASLTASIPEHYATTYQGLLGLTQKF